MTGEWAEIDAYSEQLETLKEELNQSKKSKKTFDRTVGAIGEQLRTWEGLRDQLKDGKNIYAPFQFQKRKNTNIQGQRKKQRLGDDETDNDHVDEQSENSTDENENTEDEFTNSSAKGTPLTKEAVIAKIMELCNTKKEAKRHRSELNQKIRKLKDASTKVKESKRKIEAKMQHLCISGRNNYAKGEIQQDFAQGIKELDQDIAAEEDGYNFNPEQEVRNYEEVARSLPVFCVSSRGYQKLKGRLRKDPAVSGFQTVDDTEIPQLQDHCRSLTVSERTNGCKRFMTNLSQLLNSITLWTSSEACKSRLTEAQSAVEKQILQANLEKFKSVSDLSNSYFPIREVDMCIRSIIYLYSLWKPYSLRVNVAQ